MILLYVQSAVHTVLYNVIPPGVGGLIYVIINVKAMQERERTFMEVSNLKANF